MSNDDDKPNEVSTSDMYFAAFLRTKGLTMIDRLREGKRMTWVFELPEGVTAKRLGDLWFTGDRIPALEYSNSIRILKSTVAGV